VRDGSREPTRVEIVIDTDDPNPDLLFIWVVARAVKMVEQLRSNGISAELVRIDVDGRRHYTW
jgi:hypothetical protein